MKLLVLIILGVFGPLCSSLIAEGEGDLWDKYRYRMDGPKYITAEEWIKEGLGVWAKGWHPYVGTCFSNAVFFEPDNPSAHYWLGRAKMAADSFQHVDTIRGKFSGTTFLNGLSAEWEFQRALRIKPDMAEAHRGLGSVYEKKGWDAEAEFEYLEAIRLNPSYLDGLISMAELLDKQKQRKEGRHYWEQALTLEKRPEWLERIKKRLAEPD